MRKTSPARRKRSSGEHTLYPGRVERLLEGGIDFVPGRREGYRYWDVDGRELLDLHLNGGTFSLGHRNPELIRILADGLAEWDVGNHHFGSEPKAELAQALVESAAGRMKYVVLTCGGSEATDVAIKSARHATGRRRIVAIDAAFLMLCSLNYLGWLQKRGENVEHADRLAGEIINELLKYIPQLMQQLTVVQRAVVNLLVWKY